MVFGKFGDMAKQMKMISRMMKDENFKAILANPKMRALMQDPEFIALAKSGDMNKVKSNPKFASTFKDPEIQELFKKVDFTAYL